MPKEVCTLCDISYRQLQYWDRTNFIKPSYRRRGRYRFYVFSDLVQVKLAKWLRDRNYSIQRIRNLVKSLRALLLQTTSPLRDLTFMIKKDNLLVLSGEVVGSMGDLAQYHFFKVETLVQEVEQQYPGEGQPSGGALQ